MWSFVLTLAQICRNKYCKFEVHVYLILKDNSIMKNKIFKHKFNWTLCVNNLFFLQVVFWGSVNFQYDRVISTNTLHTKNAFLYLFFYFIVLFIL